jgi:Zn-dependent protease with chaperone function
MSVDGEAVTGSGIFYDGISSTRHDVSVEVAPHTLRIRASDGAVLAEWPYAEIEELSAPDGMLRVGRAGQSVLARLEVRDPALAHAIDLEAHAVDRTGGLRRRTNIRVVAWSVAAAAALIAVAVLGVPAIAERLAPIVPMGIEQRLGAAVDAQVRSMLDTDHAGDKFECGSAESERPGRAVLDKLMARMTEAAALPIQLRVTVVRKDEANAIALPGGRVYVFGGLIDKAVTPDELAGVIAHEVGHVAHRDGTKSVLHTAGLSFLFGMLLGDFFGGGAVVVAAKTVLQSAYSREVESAADVYAVDLMRKLGANGRALGEFLLRVAGERGAGLKILLDHPEAAQRAALINRLAPAIRQSSLLSEAEWSALKRICAVR